MRSQSLVLIVSFLLSSAFLPAMLCSEARGEALNLIDTFILSPCQVTSIGGLAPDGSNLYTGDLVVGDPTKAGYHHIDCSDGAILASGGVPSTNVVNYLPTGAARKGENLLMTVFTAETTGIVEFTPGGAVSAVYQLQGTESNTRSKGLTWDGKFIWQAHYSPGCGRLFAIDPTTGDRVNELRVDPYAFGLALDGNNFLVSHHNPTDSTSYIARYDRSGEKLGYWSLPGDMSPKAAIGDMAVTENGLYAHVLGSNTIAHFAMPASSLSPPSLPSSVHAYSVNTQVGISYDGKTVVDSQTGVGYEQLPIAASLEREMADDGIEVESLARTYYDESGVHNVVNAFAYGQNRESELQADATLTVSKTIYIAPSSSFPYGTAVWANGQLTFNGVLQAFRFEGEGEGEGWPEADGMSAVFGAKVIKTGPGGEVTCFDGSVSLIGQEGEAWVQAVITGGANTGAIQQACAAMTMTDELASLTLDDIKVGFSVYAVVGQAFDVDIIFNAQAIVPCMTDGLAIEAAFGTDGDLGAEYTGPDDGPGPYEDGYTGGPWPGWQGWVPEPSTAVLLVIGALLGRWRRRNNRRNYA